MDRRRRQKFGSRSRGGRRELGLANRDDIMSQNETWAPTTNLRRWAEPTLLGLAVAAMAVAMGHAQDPFAAPPAGAPAAGEKKEGDPFAAGEKTAVPAAAGKKKEAAPPPPDTLAIKLLRDTNPTTPAELLRAADAALALERPDESKRYLAKLVAAQPADDVLAGLASKYGDFLLRLIRIKELQPEGMQVSEKISQAAQRVAQNAERMQQIITRLSAGEQRDRQAALEQLRTVGTSAVMPLLAVLTDAGREPEHRNIRAALVHLGSTVELPLIAALDAPSDELKAQVIAVLGRMESKRATRHLVRLASDPQVPAQVRDVAAAALTRIMGATPDLYEARRYLSHEVERFMHGELPDRPDLNGLIEVWSWDESKGEATARKLPARDAGLHLAARLTKDLAAVSPGDNHAQRQMVLANLELAKTLGGLDQPVVVGTLRVPSIAGD